jgi:subtilase family serine protease
MLLQPGALVPEAAASLPAGLSPAQVRHAYGFDQVAFAKGSIRGDGSGQTITIVDAYDQPDLARDLASFDSTYGIAAPPSLTKVNQSGGASLPVASVSWGLEESLDVEWAHAIAPGARIVLVEANSANLADLLTSVDYARHLAGVSVVSMSWGAGEFSGESNFDSHFTTPAGHAGVTFVASSGDGGSASAPEWPSVAANVLAVGGTQLSTNRSGNYLGETAWSGSGGGISAFEPQPGYQKGVVARAATRRTVPDVAYDGSGGSPFAVYDTVGYSGWLEVYGTSAGAPQWAALVAIADQGRALAGKGSLDGPTQTLPGLYQLPASDFHDVTSGSNGGYAAGSGYDLVTGRGSPVANLIVSALVGKGSAPTPPQVAVPAHAALNPVTGTTTVLSVSGTDAAGASALTYTWRLLGSPAGAAAPGFSANGTNAAQNTTVSFHGAGTYSFLVTLRDPAGLTATSSLTLTVSQSLTSVSITPGSASVADGHSQQFSVTARDQFGNTMSRPPAWSWSVVGAGFVSGTGVYTAPASGSGTATLKLTGGGKTLTASVGYYAAAPAPPSNVVAKPVSSGWVLVTWKASSNNQTGFVIQRSMEGRAWQQIGAVGGSITFFDDTTASSQHKYAYRVLAYNGAGYSAASNPTASVSPSVAKFSAAQLSVGSSGPSRLAAPSGVRVRQLDAVFEDTPGQAADRSGIGSTNKYSGGATPSQSDTVDVYWQWLGTAGVWGDSE